MAKRKPAKFQRIYSDEQVVIEKRNYADGSFRIQSRPKGKHKMRRL